jgi:hypothetical protein
MNGDDSDAAAVASAGKKFQPLVGGPDVQFEAPHKFEAKGTTTHPPIYSGVVGEPEKPLQDDTDAMRWAGEFMQAAQFTWERGQKIDKATMMTWFSNSIMCGFDEATRRYAGVIADLKNETFSLKRIIEVNRVALDQRAGDRARLHLARRLGAVWAVLAFLAGIVTTLFVLMGFAVAHR